MKHGPHADARPQARLYPTRDVMNEVPWHRRRRLLAAAVAAIARAGQGRDIHYLRFEFDGLTLALASRWNEPRRRLTIEVDLCGPDMPRIVLPTKLVRVNGRAARPRRE